MEQVKTLKVNVVGIVNLQLDELHEFQDEIKILTPENFEKLKAEILADGFSFSPHVFLDGEGKAWILDGHQRRACLAKMREEGYEIPSIPCVEVSADSLDHARSLVLAGTSEYGTFKPKALAAFLVKAKIDTNLLATRFALAEKVTSQLRTVTFQVGTKDEQGKLDEKKKATCPNCQHVFTP